jgi:hypothetical protein
MRRTAFSAMTTAPAMTTPKSTAPRLIRLAEMPKTRMPIKAPNIDSGITAATMAAARMSPRAKKSTAMTSRPPSTRLLRTVRMVPLMTVDWS